MREKTKGSLDFFDAHSFGVTIFASVFIFVFACFGLVVANSESVEPSDSHLVSVLVDGEEEIIPSRAATVGEFVAKLDVAIGASDVVEPTPDTAIDSDNFKIRILKAVPTTIVDGGVQTSLLSPYADAREAVERAGIELFDEDEVSLEFPENTLISRILGRKLVISRSKQIFVNIYGTAVDKHTMAETVGELLKEMNIIPNADDIVQPSPETMLGNKSQVFITKFGKQLISVEEEIAFQTNATEDNNLSKGSVKIIEQGVKGRKIVTYELTLANGQESGRTLIQEAIITQPKTEKIIRGTRPLFADYNADGIPARVFCGSPKQQNWKNISVENAAAGRSLAAERGWTGSEFDALLELFACESSWNEKAGNPFSGAYGIPQSLPASKMASFGDDYMTNPVTQIRWGLNYVAARYSTPSAALSAHYQKNWY